MCVAKAEAAKAEALQQTPTARLKICTNAQWRVLMAIIASLSDKNSNNSVKMTQKSCFLVDAKPGFGPGSRASFWIWSRLSSLILDLVPAPCCEPGPLWSHRNSFSLYIVRFPSLGIFIAVRYNNGHISGHSTRKGK